MSHSFAYPPTGNGGLDPQRVLAALSLAGSGRVFDLDIGRFAGMPHHPAQPGFDVVTYLSPQGSSNERQRAGKPPAVDRDNFGVVLEKVTTSMHMGTHLDALCHVTAGEDCHGFGGFNGVDDVGDKGVLANDVTEVPPIVARGVLLDVAAVLGVPKLPPEHAITASELEEARGRAGVGLRPGDVVLVHTGHLRDWPAYEFGPEPGLSLEAALWLSRYEPFAVGCDNSAIEVMPSVIAERAQPVHVELIVERGIYLIEWVGLEELAAASVGEFLFICLPLKIKGATGSLVRPVAVA
jgi:kynurenine formamidase